MTGTLNNRLILETYKEDRALKATVSNGFAMVAQKVTLKGLKALADAGISQNGVVYTVSKGDIVYIKESLLQSQQWAKAAFTADGIEGEFIIVDASNVDFVSGSPE